MEVVGRSRAWHKVRALAVAGVVAAWVISTPTKAAPADQPSYRRLIELESTRSFSDGLTAALASSDTSLAGRAAQSETRLVSPL